MKVIYGTNPEQTPRTIRVTDEGFLNTRSIGKNSYSSAAAENKAIVAARPAVFGKLYAYNTKLSAQYIQIFDSATAPANGSVPKFVIPVAADSPITPFVFPMAFTAGIFVCNSSTSGTKTLGSADCLFTVDFD